MMASCLFPTPFHASIWLSTMGSEGRWPRLDSIWISVRTISQAISGRSRVLALPESIADLTLLLSGISLSPWSAIPFERLKACINHIFFFPLLLPIPILLFLLISNHPLVSRGRYYMEATCSVHSCSSKLDLDGRTSVGELRTTGNLDSFEYQCFRKIAWASICKGRRSRGTVFSYRSEN